MAGTILEQFNRIIESTILSATKEYYVCLFHPIKGNAYKWFYTEAEANLVASELLMDKAIGAAFVGSLSRGGYMLFNLGVKDVLSKYALRLIQKEAIESAGIRSKFLLELLLEKEQEVELEKALGTCVHVANLIRRITNNPIEPETIDTDINIDVANLIDESAGRWVELDDYLDFKINAKRPKGGKKRLQRNRQSITWSAKNPAIGMDIDGNITERRGDNQYNYRYRFFLLRENDLTIVTG